MVTVKTSKKSPYILENLKPGTSYIVSIVTMQIRKCFELYLNNNTNNAKLLKKSFLLISGICRSRKQVRYRTNVIDCSI